MASSASSTYRTHPVQLFPWLSIESSHTTLAQTLFQAANQLTCPKIIVIDGFVGVRWHDFITHLRAAFDDCAQDVRWLSTESCFRPANEIQLLLETSLTQDPVLGRVFHGSLQDLWLPTQQKQLQTTAEEPIDECITIVYGFGASLITTKGIHAYIDVPKDIGQQLAGQKAICNVGALEPEIFSLMYKRFYFIDWPMLNRIKRAELARSDLFIDGSNQDMPKFMHGEDFRSALHEMAQMPFRVKPWFAPGPWGGQWMKEQFGLPTNAPNYAWSFELIAPENGILLGNAEQYFECAFDYLLWAETDAVLGISVASRYGSYFPIRFDYLDTMSGTNLSFQVHPHVDYIRTEFGEPLTQDETYYIVACAPEANVFLGLREDTSVEALKADALAARDQCIPFEITDHVNAFHSKPHDLFLIPSGTVHCSGANNLVLEISATPYIFTFKIYDYLRSDLSGNLRHVHLDHAFANIDPDRTTAWVQQNLIPQPQLLREGTGWAEYSIGNIDQLFFAIHRLEFTDAVEDDTMGKFAALNLVEGDHCEILTPTGAPVELRFAESIIIPASVGRYTLRNMSHGICKVVKAFVKY